VQVALNAQLKQSLRTALPVVCISVLVSTIALWLYLAFVRLPLPQLTKLTVIPLWAWFGGGLCGTAYLFLTLIFVQRLGATTLFGLIISGNIIPSFTLDHFWLARTRCSSSDADQAFWITFIGGRCNAYPHFLKCRTAP
jgi:bacterial/archaeal transporter family-2 protein